MTQIIAIVFIVLWVGFGVHIYRNYCTTTMDKIVLPVLAGVWLAFGTIAIVEIFVVAIVAALGLTL